MNHILWNPMTESGDLMLKWWEENYPEMVTETIAVQVYNEEGVHPDDVPDYIWKELELQFDKCWECWESSSHFVIANQVYNDESWCTECLENYKENNLAIF